jgi:hypothetical protein
MLMAPEDSLDGRGDPRLEKRGAFAPRDEVPVRLVRPACPGFRESLRQLVGAQAFPFAEKNLANGVQRLGSDADRAAEDGRGLERALQVAGIEAGPMPPGQPPAQQLRLPPTFVGERGIELALDPVLTIPGRLAVANQEQASGRWLESER